MTEDLSLETITLHYKILGLSFTATKEQVRRARNKLLMTFHPDRHPKGWVMDDESLESRVQRIQNAYQFIIQNFEQIATQFTFMDEGIISSRTPHQMKSYWVYTEVAKLKDN